MDKIIIKNAKFKCNIGVTEKERGKKQEILIDAELFFNIKKNLKDDIKNTVNYSEVHKTIKNIAEKKECKLIETLAGNIAKKILSDYQIKKIIVKAKKPKALHKKNVGYAAVELTRKKNG